MRSFFTRLLLLLSLFLVMPALGEEGLSERYEANRRAYQTLRADPERRQFRHHWENLIHKLEALLKENPPPDPALDARIRYLIGLAWRDVYSQSYLTRDLERALQAFAQVSTLHPDLPLADDALYQQGEICFKLNRNLEARKLLRQVLETYPEGNRIDESQFLLEQVQKAINDEYLKPGTDKKDGGPEKTPTEKSTSEKAVSEKTATDKTASEKTGSEKVAAEKASTDKVTSDKSAAEKGNDEGAVASRGAGDRSTAGPAGTESASSGQPVDPGARPASTPRPEAPPATAVLEPAPPRSAPAAAPSSAAGEKSAAEGQGAGAQAETLPPDFGRPTDPVVPKAKRKYLVIVVDAGHGGDDSGAKGPNGVMEKDIVLSIARKIKKKLSTLPDVHVIMTRNEDVFLPLQERTEIANRYEADLFISIHANASTNPEHFGIETYYLDNASDAAAEKQAARENAVLQETRSDLAWILTDLLVAGNVEYSRHLAQAVQEAMITTLRKKYAPKTVKDLGVKTALFYVLVGAQMPSILLETSFISHKREEERLNTAEYQNQIADAVRAGVKRYLDDTRKRR